MAYKVLTLGGTQIWPEYETEDEAIIAATMMSHSHHVDYKVHEYREIHQTNYKKGLLDAEKMHAQKLRRKERLRKYLGRQGKTLESIKS